MEFSVMASSFLQPNMLLCGTKEGDIYVLETFERPITDNAITLQCDYPSELSHHPSDLVQSAWRRGDNEVKNLILARYPSLFNNGICCIEHHPRLPSLIAVGLCDGSVHLLFLEGENLGLKKTIFVFKFNGAVHQLEWVLVDAIKDCENLKRHSTSFADRVWKTLSKSPYHSILVGRSGDNVWFIVVERNFKAPTVLCNSREGYRRDENGCTNQGICEGTNAEKCMDGEIQSGDGAMSRPYDAEHTIDNICMISTIKWPLAAYFENDLEYPTLTNFCKVRESLCVLRHADNHMYMEIYTPEVNDDVVRFTRFAQQVRMRSHGRATSIQISPKQYNQINRYLSTNNENLFNLNGETCLNALAEFIAIGTNDGYVYTTSMLHVYNAVHYAMRGYERPSASCHETSNHTCSEINTRSGTTESTTSPQFHQRSNGEEANGALATTSANKLDEWNYNDMNTGDSNSASLSKAYGGAIDPGTVDIVMSSCYVGAPVVALKWALIWNDFTRPPYIIEPTQCCCTDDIIFLLTALTSEHIDLLRLSKYGLGLRISSYKRLNTRCYAIHWVENTIPNDMTLWMSTSGGMEGLTCGHSSLDC